MLLLLDLARYRQLLAVYKFIQNEASYYYRCRSRKLTRLSSYDLLQTLKPYTLLSDVFCHLPECLQSHLLWQQDVCLARVPSTDSFHGVNLWLPCLPHPLQVECKLVGVGRCRQSHSKFASQFVEYSHLHVFDSWPCWPQGPIVPWPGKLSIELDNVT